MLKQRPDTVIAFAHAFPCRHAKSNFAFRIRIVPPLGPDARGRYLTVAAMCGEQELLRYARDQLANSANSQLGFVLDEHRPSVRIPVDDDTLRVIAATNGHAALRELIQRVITLLAK
jgi:hypothetical protein